MIINLSPLEAKQLEDLDYSELFHCLKQVVLNVLEQIDLIREVCRKDKKNPEDEDLAFINGTKEFLLDALNEVCFNLRNIEIITHRNNE